MGRLFVASCLCFFILAGGCSKDESENGVAGITNVELSYSVAHRHQFYQ